MTITVVTPWFEHRELAGDYWHAMRQAGNPPVIVVDNGSQPPLPNAWRIETNTGFSHACNVGLELARTDAVLFLNNDIAPASTGWLETLTQSLEPGVLVGANLRFDAHAAVDNVSLPYLDGWCLAGMRDDLLELDGFDEDYQEPSYYGDNDLSFRARLAGMTLREAPVGLIHKANATAGPAATPNVQAATAANRARYQQLVRSALAVAA